MRFAHRFIVCLVFGLIFFNIAIAIQAADWNAIPGWIVAAWLAFWLDHTELKLEKHDERSFRNV